MLSRFFEIFGFRFSHKQTSVDMEGFRSGVGIQEAPRSRWGS